MTKIEAKRKRYKGLTMIVVLVLGAAIVVQVLLQTMVEQVTHSIAHNTKVLRALSRSALAHL